ncbi:jg5088 [Pararge aegeria aegeria]|uniref:Jg5088 protein n=1 Tax=Pararge aegeria aegeria TaxID=348720 RepID=A0A8S4QM42_9NEOP|nr:jg5088 [Pararge aegeria aegeria]
MCLQLHRQPSPSERHSKAAGGRAKHGGSEMAITKKERKYPAKFVVGFFLDQDALRTLVALVLSLRIWISPSSHYRVILMYASKVTPMGLLE